MQSEKMIRDYKESDFDALVDLDYNSDHPFYIRDKTKKPEIRSWLKKKFKKNLEKFYVFIKNKEIVGAVGYNKHFFAPNSCEITYLAVKREYHRQGIATKLMNFMENTAKKARYRSIYLYTGKTNKTARKFYKKKGYKLYAKLPDHYTWGEDAVLFRKDLKVKK
ncbi:MAG: GNAT family N-acetyltransferase [Candidatus Woesearchaeota archaeon]